MRLVVQRVRSSHVEVENQIVGKIGKGLMVLLGIQKKDRPEDTVWLVNRLVNLRVFQDEQQKMNLSVLDVKGELLVISQFTLYGECSKGRRPDFFEAAPASQAEPIYRKFITELTQHGLNVQEGIFGAFMQVSLVNDGPVTLIIENPS